MIQAAAIRLRLLACAVLLFAAAPGHANDQRAAINYMLHCQGCHLPEAEGFPGKVPRINGFIGNFLGSSEGREYLIQVPGVATAGLDDADVAELMNWMINKFGAEQLPDGFDSYTTEEVARLRRSPELSPNATRSRILRELGIESNYSED